MIMRLQKPVLVVIGTGMAGGKLVQELLDCDKDRFEIRMFGSEPSGTYNRILLSKVLGGQYDPQQLWLNPLEWYNENRIFVHAGISVDTIDRENQFVIGGNGKVKEPYDYLVLATGSRPFVPPIEGIKQQGVFVFRTLEDCEKISAYAQNCDRVVVLGGGLLGLEAARGLMNHDVEVTVVEMAPHLMAQQLDPPAAILLRKQIEALGIETRTGISATAILGDGRVTGVKLNDGSIIETDMVIVSCGIRPNSEIAKSAGLSVDRGILVNDQLQTSDDRIFAIGECAQHRGQLYGLVDPVYEQARICAQVLANPESKIGYEGTRLGTSLKVMGIEVTSMGNVHSHHPDAEVVSYLDTNNGTYRKFVMKDGKLEGAILLGVQDRGNRFLSTFKSQESLTATALDLLVKGLESEMDSGDVTALADDCRICNCNTVSKLKIVKAIQNGATSVTAIGECTRAGTGCGSCQPLVSQLIDAYDPNAKERPKTKNKIEVMKEELPGLDSLPRLLDLAGSDNWQGMTEEDKQRAKWYGLFFRKPTPGHFMMRVRFIAGQSNSEQFRELADLSDEFGKGFCDLTTRQQLQLRWFTLKQTPEIWKRLEKVGLHSKQTGMDNIRGIISCPVGGLTPNEAFNAIPVAEEYERVIIDNSEFTNLPRKFNLTVTGCLENCCHPETQDIGLIPAVRETSSGTENGFNVLVGGKQGSGGYRPASKLDVFVPIDEAAKLSLEMTRIFRDNGSREARPRARLAFLIEDKGVAWFRSQLEKRFGKPLAKAGNDLRKKHHVDHLGIHPQKPGVNGERLFMAGLLVPVGRITTAQMRGVADLADRYGDGKIKITVNQNLIVTGIPESKLESFKQEPVLKELTYEPSPIMRGLVTCTGNDYCHMALIETKGWALEIAKELEIRTAGKKVKPLTMHWSGCPAGCGLHQVGTIGLQGCRSRIDGKIVDSAHVYINGKTGPNPVIATDLMYDVPCDRLVDALEPLVTHLPR